MCTVNVCVHIALRGLRPVALQVKDPRTRFPVGLRALAGDGQIAKPRSRKACCRGLKRHHNVLGLFGGDGVYVFDSKTGVVHLGTWEIRLH